MNLKDWLAPAVLAAILVVPVAGTVWAIAGGGHLRDLRKAWSGVDVRNPDHEAKEAEVWKIAGLILIRIGLVWALVWLVAEAWSRLK